MDCIYRPVFLNLIYFREAILGPNATSVSRPTLLPTLTSSRTNSTGLPLSRPSAYNPPEQSSTPSNGQNQQSSRAAVGGLVAPLTVTAVTLLIWYILYRYRQRMAQKNSNFDRKALWDEDTLSEMSAGRSGHYMPHSRDLATNLKSWLYATIQAIRSLMARLQFWLSSQHPFVRRPRSPFIGSPQGLVTESFSGSRSGEPGEMEFPRNGVPHIMSNPFANLNPSQNAVDNPSSGSSLQMAEGQILPLVNSFADHPGPGLSPVPDCLLVPERRRPGPNSRSGMQDYIYRSCGYGSDEGTNSTTIGLPARRSSGSSRPDYIHRSSTTDLAQWGQECDVRASIRSDPFDLERPPTIFTQ